MKRALKAILDRRDKQVLREFGEHEFKLAGGKAKRCALDAW